MESDAARSRGRARFTASLVPVGFLLLSVWLCLEALQVPFGSFRMPGAGFFPLLLGITLGVLSLVLLSIDLLGDATTTTLALPVRAEVFYLMGAIFASVWLFERAGFALTMVLFLSVVLKVLGKLGWTTTVVLAFVGSLAAYVVFGRVLMIALPSGILPF
jgi:putative tricarboxylic transport membrane protein